jgi:hypothetical protein
MRRFSLYIALASVVLWPLALAAQNIKPESKPLTKSIEVKHFTNTSGVQLSPDFLKHFYSSFLAETQRLNIASQTVEEGASVVDTDSPHSLNPHFLVLEGTFVNIQEGHENGGLFAAGSARIDLLLYRRNNHKLIIKNKIRITLNGSLQKDEQKVAESAGIEAADVHLKTWHCSNLCDTRVFQLK